MIVECKKVRRTFYISYTHSCAGNSICRLILFIQIRRLRGKPPTDYTHNDKSSPSSHRRTMNTDDELDVREDVRNAAILIRGGGKKVRTSKESFVYII